MATTGIWWAATRVWDRQHQESGGAGSGADITFRRNREGMVFCRHRLLYHFLEAYTPIDVQVARVWFTLQGHLDQGEAVMVDCEHDSTTNTACTEAQAFEFCQRMEEITHRPVVVYTNRSIDGGNIWHSSMIFDGTRPRIYPDYKTGPDEPLTWAEMFQKVQERTAPYGYDAWQYSSTGHLPGIQGNVDLDQVEDWRIFERACGYPVQA